MVFVLLCSLEVWCLRLKSSEKCANILCILLCMWVIIGKSVYVSELSMSCIFYTDEISTDNRKYLCSPFSMNESFDAEACLSTSNLS